MALQFRKVGKAPRATRKQMGLAPVLPPNQRAAAYANTMTKVIVKVQGQGGAGTTEIDAQVWSYMSPSVRVLYLHKHCRKATKGQPFDVVSVVKIEG